LVAMGGCAGWHGVLSLGNRERASVVGRFGRGSAWFSRDTLEPKLGQVATVHPDARRGWQRVEVTTPCSPACTARLGGVQVFGNAQHALRVLGGTGVLGWHGRGGTHGRPRAGLAWGIDPWGRCEADGEKMAWEVASCTLPKHGAHGRRWQHPVCRKGGDGGSLWHGVGVGF
jgi:hypothetical protein